ncbi:beta-N-acetylhexosaminidase [Afifella sp. JA880]|uniref:beta-N-acetylhexosaminidase n=1 Tax=Afifella sp. JA880 TaxID=2975280 RepID=UPI0021BBA1F3|nr:beta-N-acetylhexosaminidase [Afifella sp. JA880]MCT8265766.1 beta-N-acetylhexosaminidase [Afifella sp. JA880]
MMAKAFACGLAGLTLGEEERAFLRDEKPWGVILFARNIQDGGQIRRLTDSVRETLDRPDVPILIDQEGGRVQRIRPPVVRSYPPAKRFGDIYKADPISGIEAAQLAAKLMALDLIELGINVDCLPVLDVPGPGSHDIIGDRAYGDTVDMVVTLGGAVMTGLRASGVTPVIKHLPGHGRAASDSHEELPVVDADLAALEAVDFAPFRMLATRASLGIVAHVVYSAVDDAQPATHSAAIIANIIRERIGFDGLLMTDDISMKALSGSPAERSRRAIAAGCDIVLHCNGEMEEMREVAKAVPEVSGDALERAEMSLVASVADEVGDRAFLHERLSQLLGSDRVLG